MFRLIKLAMFGLMGYALYEIYQGVMQGESSSRRGIGGGSRALNRALNEDSGRMSAPTNTGRGQVVSTGEASGTSMRHTVGRGVVSR